MAEMTGRKGRVVSTEEGDIKYESRSEVDIPLETLNITGETIQHIVRNTTREKYIHIYPKSF